MTLTSRPLTDAEQEAACGLITALNAVVTLNRIPPFVVIVALSELLASLSMQVPEDQSDAFHEAMVSQMKFAYRNRRDGASIGTPQGST